MCDALTEEYLSNEGDDSADKRDLESVLRGDGGVQNLINCKSTETDKTWQTMQWEACLTKYIRFRDYQTENTAIKQRHKEAKPGVINDKPPITEYDSLPAFEFSGSNALVQIALIVIIAAVLFYAFYVD